VGPQVQQGPLTGYDRVPYPGHPFAQTHPDRLATVATLFGLRPAPPDACRVLELGCGDGGNLVPMAYGLPGSTFAGVDLSGRAIGRARARAAALGLENVRFELADLTALPALGEFDYVVVHGVYSWIDPAARDALLAACHEHLAPDGVAYVSYDVLPGGHMREITRQMLRWHLRAVDEPEERIAQARALLAAIVEARPEGDEMHLVAQRALQQADPSIFHDELAPHHEAVLFTDFVAHAAAHGLRFLAEADVFEMEARGLPPGLAEDTIEREQYLDFFKGRMFRQTLLCHAGAELREGGLEVVRGMLAATPARPVDESDGRVEFRGPSGASLTTDHDSVKAALTRLGEAWPAALPVAELGDDPAVAETLRRAYAANIVRLHVWAPELTTTPSERPVASALARLQAAEGTHVTTLVHTTVDVGDETGLRLIRLLDGTRDRAALVAELDRPADELERSLEGLARIGLLER
jgi:SAM-dependent methyltransferase